MPSRPRRPGRPCMGAHGRPLSDCAAAGDVTGFQANTTRFVTRNADDLRGIEHLLGVDTLCRPLAIDVGCATAARSLGRYGQLRSGADRDAAPSLPLDLLRHNAMSHRGIGDALAVVFARTSPIGSRMARAGVTIRWGGVSTGSEPHIAGLCSVGFVTSPSSPCTVTEAPPELPPNSLRRGFSVRSQADLAPACDTAGRLARTAPCRGPHSTGQPFSPSARGRERPYRRVDHGLETGRTSLPDCDFRTRGGYHRSGRTQRRGRRRCVTGPAPDAGRVLLLAQ